MERAEGVLDYFTGTLWERVIDRDIQANDLEALAYHISQAEKEMAIQEDAHLYGEQITEPNDVY